MSIHVPDRSSNVICFDPSVGAEIQKTRAAVVVNFDSVLQLVLPRVRLEGHLVVCAATQVVTQHGSTG
jgi:mRNA-degrading endonuclease toxin of MazEF toxin-antitoxin module